MYNTEPFLVGGFRELNRYMRYNKSYRRAVVCLIAALATVIYIAAVSVVLAVWPSAILVLGMSKFVATVTLFFVPTITSVALIFGIDFWYNANRRVRVGWNIIPEKDPSRKYKFR